MLLLPWHPRPLLILFVLAVAIAYVRGWRRVRRLPLERAPLRRLATGRLLALTLAGLALVLVALVSPLDYLGTQFFFLRMAQHLLLLNVVPALFFIPNPLPFIWFGLPFGWRRRVAEHIAGRPRRLVWTRRLTGKGLVLILFTAATLVWYDPGLHQASRAWGPLHDVEVAVMVAAGALYWWHITAAVPRLHDPLPLWSQVAYTAAGALPIKLAGLFFLFAESPLYAYPTPDLGWLSLSPLRSFHLGGAVIWMLGGVAYSYAALWLMGLWLAGEDRKPWQPRAAWDTPEVMLAPGWEK